MTLARTTKLIVWLAGLGLTPIKRVRLSFAVGVADWHPGPPGAALNTAVLSSRSLLMIPAERWEGLGTTVPFIPQEIEHLSLIVTSKAYYDWGLLSNDYHTQFLFAHRFLKKPYQRI